MIAQTDEARANGPHDRPPVTVIRLGEMGSALGATRVDR